MNKNVKGWLQFILIFVVIPFAALALLWKDACVTTQVSESVSPDGRFAVSIFATDCKGHLKPATEVRLAVREDNQKNKAQQVLLYQGKELPEFLWPTQSVLRLNYPKGAEVVVRKTNLFGVAIDIGEKG